MLLAIDIGNSSAKIGLFEAGSLTASFSVKPDSPDSAESVFEAISSEMTKEPSRAVISSVVPATLPAFEEVARRITGSDPLIADHSMDFGFEIDYKPVEDCGMDRLLAASAAVAMIGFPCIVCDLGTAATIDLVDKEGIYRGGAIAPGLRALYRSLHGETAKLPLLDPEAADNVVGNSTRTAIASGVYYGFAGLVDGIVERIGRLEGGNIRVIATGGDSEFVAEVSKHVSETAPNLVLEGLALLYERNS
ncbi:MAG: type III pantothenate kinase [Acidobacteriota bacterium]|nr:MAG: type III pantothenate kinase [Acidobacteriota bacterium]